MTIFKTRQPFRDEYIPDTVIARDDTISNLVRIFQDFVDGSRPPHLLIHGDSGTGKRTVIRHILNLVEIEVERDIEVITIDCDELQHAISTYGTAQTECGVIGTANQSRLYDHLPGEVVHRSYMHTLETTPYDAAQLRNILESRADEAFTDDGLSETVIRKCAAIIAQETGSAAEALQLLELAGYVAYQADADQVGETHVDTATESRAALDLYTTFTQDLGPKKQLLCAIIAVHTAVNMTAPTDDEESQAEEDEDDDKITTSGLYQMYENTAGSFDLNNVEKRRIEQLIGDLRDRGLVKAETHNEGRAGGTWLSYKLTVPPHQILRSATARSGRFKRFLRKHHVSLDDPSFPDDEVDIDAFLSDNWP